SGLDEDLVVIAWINPGEPDAQLKTGGPEQGAQPLQAGNHLVAFVASDQRGRHPASPAEFGLRDPRSASGLDQQIPAYHCQMSLTPNMCSFALPRDRGLLGGGPALFGRQASVG